MRRFLFCIFAFVLALPLSTSGSTLPESESNFRFAIDQVQSSLGAEVELSIRNISEPPKPGVGKGNAIGSFSFLIYYDASKLELLNIRPGKVLNEQGWGDLAVMTYITCPSVGGFDSCSAAGPVRIQATIQRKNELDPRDLSLQNNGEWLILSFKVKDDCRLSGQVLPVNWFWETCNDNKLTSFSGNRAWVVDSLISLSGHARDLSRDFPIDISNCDTLSFAKSNVKTERGITFINGGIRVAPGDCISNRGDLNLNGIAYEIADYVLYQNYFLFGDSVLFQDKERRTAQFYASDVNTDGRWLRMADLVMMARIIRGEAGPLPKAGSEPLVDTAHFEISRSVDSLFVACRNSNDIGGVFLVFSFSDSLGPPMIMDSSITLQTDYEYNFRRLHILLSPNLSADSSKLPSGVRRLLSLPIIGFVPSPYVQVSTYEGQEMPMTVSLSSDLTPPLFSNCPPKWDTLLYGRTFTFDFESDREGETGVIYSIAYGPGRIDSLTGAFSFEAICQLQPQVIVIQIRDKWGNNSYCKFAIVSADSPPSCSSAQQWVAVSNGQVATNQIIASDPDSGDVFAYYVISGPGQIDTNGLWTYQTSCRDASNSPQTVYVGVADGYGSCRPGPLNTFTSFQVDVSNHAPSITCPPNTQIVMGRPYQAQIMAQDPDPADSGNLTLSLVSGPAGLTVSPSGLVQWAPGVPDIGVHAVHLRVTDLCGASSDCVYGITVVEGTKFRIAIDTVTGLQGEDVEVSIRNLDDAADPTVANGKSVGGFSFLLAYDCSCLQFLAARKGALLVEQGWEFFTYRFGAVGSGNCGSGCPSCLIRIVGIADVNDGVHPSWARENQGEWAVLKFRTTSDQTLAGQFCPIYWFWFECTDNTLSDSTGQRVWVVDSLYSQSGALIDLATAFPSNVSNCTTIVVGKPQPKKYIAFVNGGIQLPQPSEIGGRGDLNLNGISNELADFVLFKNYFAAGEVVLFRDSLLRQLQIVNSDVNGDGLPLALSDLVTMARIITGDPNPLPTGQPQPVYVSFTREGQDLIVSTTSNFDLGGLFLRFNFSGTVGLPIKLDSAASLELAGSSDSSELRVLLVASQKDIRIPAGTQRVLSIPYTGTIEPLEQSASTYYGIALPTTVAIPKDVEESQQPAPSSFSISQNFPNPFNPSTSFTLTLPKAGHYSVRIYNLAGQVVKTYEGEAPAGKQTLSWDGTDQNGIPVSSGVYLYKAETKGFFQTKKMILIR